MNLHNVKLFATIEHTHKYAIEDDSSVWSLRLFLNRRCVCANTHLYALLTSSEISNVLTLIVRD
jgi:hypothetical protein